MLIKVRTLTGKEIELDIEPDYKVNHPSRLDAFPASPRTESLYPSTETPSLYQYFLNVSRIKERVEEKEGIPPVQQRLIFGGKQMADDKTASEYNLEGGATLHLVLALRGGCAAKSK
ncbi:hypothetical protein N7519_010691 [Penicillium mononematosum]|uniref:uncharacterized protein n=1 Tax=Penicillium mononematosum TaxID=268346 RepID=UPI0025484E70|nr:uncharacterized protein N7519_010691 [Penicillium mononematosum]KAJ6180230.1 hypothetical protein N7519_010691 [Penicillium mononematosum]